MAFHLPSKAVRAPELTIPGRKPVGPVLSSDVVCYIAPDSQPAASSDYYTHGNSMLVNQAAGWGLAFWGGIAATEGDYVEMPYLKNFALEQFTIFCHVQSSATPVSTLGIFGDYRQFAEVEYDDRSILLRTTKNYPSTPQFYVRNKSGTQYGAATCGTIAQGEHSILCAKYDGQEIKLFKNGVPGTPVSASGLVGPGAYPLRIGCYNDNPLSSNSQQPFTGLCAFLYMLRKALPDSEIAERSRSGDIFKELRPA